MLDRSFSTLGRNIGLIIIPVGMDLLSLFLGLITAGFWGQSKITFKFVINVGLPSISSVLEQNMMASGLHFDLGGSTEIAGLALLLFVMFLIVGAFLEAGFVGLLYDLARKGQPPGIQNFRAYAHRFWLRFLGLRLLVLGVTMVGLFIAMLFWVVGLLAFLIGFMVLRILYIYWEFTIVSEDLGLLEAFSRSRQHFDNRPPELSSIILAILAANFLAGLVFNGLWNPLTIFIGIFIYNYVASGLQLALMFSKPGMNDAPTTLPEEVMQ